MSDWEEFCDDMGWANDEHATDKLISHIEGKNSRSSSNFRSREFSPEQKRAYAIKKEKERQLLATPIARYVFSEFGGPIVDIRESVWTENGASYKSMYIEIGKGGMFSLTITKCNEDSFTIEFCNLTGREILETKVSGNRLTPSLIKQAINKNDELIKYSGKHSK